jgi:protease-4
MKQNPFHKNQSVPDTKPKRKWVILPFIWKVFRGLVFSLGLLVFISLVFSFFTFSALLKDQPVHTVPTNSVLYLEFKDEIRETPKMGNITDAFAEKQPTVRDIVTAIDKGARDPKIKGIAARMYDGNFNLTHIEEIRDAIKRFKTSGKFTKIYSTSYGGAGSGMGRFYLASAFDERWMQPMGIVGITGVRAEVPFVKSLLDKIGITPQFIQKKEYKTAYESAMRDGISPENKQMLTDLVNGIESILMTNIPADLGMPPQKFKELVDQGLFTSDEALDTGLITHIGYPDQVADGIEHMLGKIGAPPEDVFIPVESYLPRNKHTTTKKAADTALVYISGMIMSTNGEDFAKDGIAASEIIAPAIVEASENPDIKTIILRVDSPGGSPSASESILHAVDIAKQRGKKVIVSMGPTTASGGYWVSAYADRIFAMPSTLTGSIGVVGGKIALQDLWDKIGVNWNTDVSWGDNAGMWSVNTKFNDQERARMDAMLDHVYHNFIARVAVGRKMNVAAVEKIAKGRVWTGAQAVQNGLVDELGGLYQAMDYAAKDMGKEDITDLHIAIYPKPKTFQEELFDMLSNSGMVMSGLHTQGVIAEKLSPFLNTVQTTSGVHTYEPIKLK